MIELKRVTGQTLILEFGGTGGLSKATLDDEDVTTQACCMKMYDHKEYSELFGFQESIDPNEHAMFSPINDKLKTLGLFIQKVRISEADKYKVWLCETSAPNHVLGKTVMVADFDTYKKMFTRIGQYLNATGDFSVVELNSVL